MKNANSVFFCVHGETKLFLIFCASIPTRESGMFSKQLSVKNIALTVIFVALLGHFALAFRPVENLASSPCDDDTFYALTVAHYIAKGDGITINGDMLTNGFQPLIVFIYALFFKIFPAGLYGQIRIAYFVNALLAVLSSILLYRFVKAQWSDRKMGEFIALLSVVIWCAAFPVFSFKMKGLETGLYFVFILLSLYVYHDLVRKQSGLLGYAGFGVILGLTVLTRIDAAFLVLSFCFVHLYRYRDRWGTALKQVTIFGSVSVITSLPWWIYNILYFNSIVPISGAAQSLTNKTTEPSVIGNIEKLFYNLSNLLYPITYLPHKSILDRFFPGGSMAYSIFAVILLSLVLVVLYRHQEKISVQHIRAFVPMLLFVGFLFVFYVFFFGAKHFVYRYLSVIYIASVPLDALLIFYICEYFGRQFKIAWLVFSLLFCLLFLAYVSGIFYARDNAFYRDQYGWVREHLQPNTRIGAAQTGVLGYFWPNTVNLDGKVNPLALTALQTGTIDRYILSERIEILIDWPVNLEDNFFQSPLLARTYDEIDRSGNFGVFKRTK